jgi:transposase
MKQKNKKSNVTIGLDLGDRRRRLCAVDEAGVVVEQGSVLNDRISLGGLMRRYRGALVVLEAGCHSPWISRYLQEQGGRVLIANPRKLRAIHQNERKSDRRDAQMLARIGRLDPALLYPVRHGTQEAQEASPAPVPPSRHGSALPSARNAPATRVPPPSSNPAALLQSPSGVAKTSTGSRTKYPQTLQLQQIPGVGPITALYFVLKIEDPHRFNKVRDVGAYAGLCPRRDQSGESDPQLRISKRGDAYLCRLLVSASQYILGPFGPQSALRSYGLNLAADGTARAKKRATVAVARKLAVRLLSLWKTQPPYAPFPQLV